MFIKIQSADKNIYNIQEWKTLNLKFPSKQNGLACQTIRATCNPKMSSPIHKIFEFLLA